MKQMSLQGRSVLGLSDFSESEIERILEMAGQMKSILSSGHKKTDLLRGKSVVNLFSERPREPEALSSWRENIWEPM